MIVRSYDLPPGTIVESLEQREDGAFPASRVADQRHRLPGVYPEIQALQDARVRPGRIGEVHVLQLDLATKFLQEAK